MANRLTEEVNELPPFPISPLDDGKPPSRVPVASARVEIEGENWLLRPCNGLLFAHRESQNEGDWTFAASKPLTDDDVSAKRLGDLWSDALASQKIARFVVFYADHISRELPLFFAEGGIGWMREFWNRDDFPFEWTLLNGGKGVLTRPIDEFRWACPQVFSEYLMWPLDNWSENHPKEPAYKKEPLHFLCGSEEELERLCRLFCWSDSLMSQSTKPIRVVVNSENEFGCASLEYLNYDEIRFFRNYRHDQHSTSNRDWREGKAPPLNIQLLFELAIEENTPAGLNWEYSDSFSGRASHTPEPEAVDLIFSPPSMHEHLEARLGLREWLAARVSAEEVEELLR